MARGESMLTTVELPVVPLIAGLGAGVQAESKREFLLVAEPYGVRLATTERDRSAAYRLRIEVCEHLVVEDLRTAKIVGTYRLQRGDVAGANYGYYSEQEFCFAPYEGMRG